MAVFDDTTALSSSDYIDINIDSSEDEDIDNKVFSPYDSNTISNYIEEKELNNFFHGRNDKSISLLHVNCRSLNKNFDSLCTLLCSMSENVTAVALTETWLNASNENLFTLNGYNFVGKSRLNKIGGGVGIFLNANLNYKIRNDLSVMNEFIECIFVEITQLNASNIIIGSVYRPPNSDVTLFNSAMSTICEKISEKKSNLSFLAGDFNLDLLKVNQHIPTCEFLNLLNSHSFLPTIKYPTRITDFSTTLIDNIFVNSIAHAFDSAIIYSDISDHLPIAVRFSMHLEQRKPISTLDRRLYSPQSITNFCAALYDISWDDVITCADVDGDASESYSVFHSKFIALFDEHFPLTSNRYSKRSSPRQEWITKGLIKSCNRKSALYKKFIANPSQAMKRKYVKYRNKLKTLLMKAKIDYYKNRIASASGNLRQTWKLINGVLNNSQPDKFVSNFTKDGEIIRSAKDIVEHFNDFFVNVGNKLANLIPAETKHYSTYMPLPQLNSFSFFPTDPNEVKSIVANFVKKSSYGYDGVPVDIMKSVINPIAAPLSSIINCSIRTGVFPDNLKIAKVCPVHKSGSESAFENYRPISVLPSFSKVYEKVVYNRLENFVSKNKLLSNSQYGFRPKHSTYMPILDIYDKISQSVDCGKFAVGIFIDLAKAFDTINHDILCCKLERYGVRGIALQWFRNYLTNRSQYVYFNGVSSSLKSVLCGVPQGSILGPLLFLLYINDIVRCSSVLNFILFADDTNLFYSSVNFDELVITLNTELDKLCTWFRANKLSLNVKKTNFIMFGKKSKAYQDNEVKILLNGIPIERVHTSKFLGIFLDDDLNWKFHISQISLKVSRSIGVLNKVKKLFSKEILRTLYFTMIQPHLIYCNIVWGGATQLAINRLIVLQKRAVRIVSHSNYRAPTAAIFKELKILTIEDIHKMQLALFVYKHLKLLLPLSCLNHIQVAQATHKYTLRHYSSVNSMYCRTNVRERYVGVSAPRVWDSLPDELKLIESLAGFNLSLKMYLISLY